MPVMSPRAAGVRRAQTLAVPLGLIVVVLLVFSPVLFNGFVDWDDDVTLVSNPHYRGVGWSQLGWMWTTMLGGHWVPFTWLTFAFDYLVWGMNPVGYHLTSLLIHTAGALVFYSVASRLLALAFREADGSVAVQVGAAAAALAFAIHPLRVESVAWATERRDVLSGLFYLLAIAAYLRWQASESGRRRWYWYAVAFAAAALLSKSLTLTLPAALLMIDAYPLRRFAGAEGWWVSARRLVVEKLPFIGMTLLVSAVAFVAVAPVGNMAPLRSLGLGARLALAADAIVFYVGKTFMPANLSPLYEFPARVDPLAPSTVASYAIVLAVTGAGVLLWRRVPALLAVWIVYVVTVLPVSGVFQSGPQLRADRYSYLSCLGWALVVGGTLTLLVRAGGWGRVLPGVVRLGVAATVLWLLGVGILTLGQIPVWRDAETLWRYTVAVDPSCGRCRFGLGLVLAAQKGLLEPAIEQFEAGFAARPDLEGIGLNLSLALAKLHRFREARQYLERLADEHPDSAAIRARLGAVLLEDGEPERAIGQFEAALRLDPDRAEALGNLGIALAKLGRPEAALPHLARAAALSPTSPGLQVWLARTRRALGEDPGGPQIQPAQAPALPPSPPSR
jgi:hypothetical protein